MTLLTQNGTHELFPAIGLYVSLFISMRSVHFIIPIHSYCLSCSQMHRGNQPSATLSTHAHVHTRTCTHTRAHTHTYTERVTNTHKHTHTCNTCYQCKVDRNRKKKTNHRIKKKLYLTFL